MRNRKIGAVDRKLKPIYCPANQELRAVGRKRGGSNSSFVVFIGAGFQGRLMPRWTIIELAHLRLWTLRKMRAA
jgi:hypothetical protein